MTTAISGTDIRLKVQATDGGALNPISLAVCPSGVGLTRVAIRVLALPDFVGSVTYTFTWIEEGQPYTLTATDTAAGQHISTTQEIQADVGTPFTVQLSGSWTGHVNCAACLEAIC